MEYLLDLGHVEQSIARQALQAGQPLPERIANAPKLQIGLQLYLQAFFDLDSERSHAHAPTAIPWSSVANYARTFELDEEQTDDLFFHVRKLDNVQLKKIAKQIQNKGK